MGQVRLPNGRGIGKKSPLFHGAIVAFGDTKLRNFGAVPASNFMIDVPCFAKHGGQSTAKKLVARKISGICHKTSGHNGYNMVQFGLLTPLAVVRVQCCADWASYSRSLGSIVQRCLRTPLVVACTPTCQRPWPCSDTPALARMCPHPPIALALHYAGSRSSSNSLELARLNWRLLQFPLFHLMVSSCLVCWCTCALL